MRSFLAGESNYLHRVITILLLAALAFGSFGSASAATTRYTPKQIEGYKAYTGKTYWIAEEQKIPPFLTAASATAPTFQPGLKESFELDEIVGEQSSSPFYKATFASGKQGYIPVVTFIEHLNEAFVSVDPDRYVKAKAAKEEEEENKRREWIASQRWPEHVKQAALKKQPALGMNKKEATAVLGKPKRVVPLKTANMLMGRQEQWIYDNGPVLTFSNGIITRIQPADSPRQ